MDANRRGGNQVNYLIRPWLIDGVRVKFTLEASSFFVPFLQQMFVIAIIRLNLVSCPVYDALRCLWKEERADVPKGTD